ncbi:MAG: S41 family peptidase [Bacteroidota bacterium]
MKIFNPYKSIFFLSIGITLLLTGCKKDPEPEPEPGLPEEILVLNNWIWDGMNDLYLWEEFIPNLDPEYEEDPEAFFYRLLYKDDKDSWITDDYEALIASFEGVDLATGMSVSPGLIDDTRVISIVEYVTPNTPASDSGIVRGDIIIAIDGQALTRDNYFDLYYQATATFGFGSFDGVNPVPDGREVTLTAVELNLNPFVHHELIDYEGVKIGYCVYTSFVPGPADEWMDEIYTVLGEFQEAGVTDVVIDLRYNGGGYGYVCEQMASVLAPENVVSNHSIFSTQIWNEGYTQYWKEADLDEDGEPDGEESWRLLSRFPDTDLNLNLSRVYILTTNRTASASEMLIVGLDPHMDVIQIGASTYGKCYGSVTIPDLEDPKRHNWAMQPIVLKYANADGFTDFVNGLGPDFIVEDLLLYATPFGSLGDPLLAKALEQITGVAPGVRKSVSTEMFFERIPVPRRQIPELKLDWPLKPVSSN